MTTNERRILLLCGIGHLYSHFYMLAFPSMAMWIQHDFELSFGETVRLGFWMYLLYGITALPFGALGDKIKSHYLLAGAILSTGIFAVFAGFAQSALQLQLALAGIGISAAVYHPVGMSLISRCCKNRGMALGRNGVWGSTGLAGAPIFAGVVTQASSWQLAFWISGGAAVAAGIFLLTRAINETSVDTDAIRKTPKAGTRSAFAVMLVCMTLLGFCYRSVTVVLPAWFRLQIPDLDTWLPGSSQGGESFGAAVLVGISYSCGILGQLTGGKVADRFDLRFAYLITHSLALPCLFLVSFLTGIPLVIAAAAYLFFSLGMQPIENTLVATLTPERYRSLAYGTKFILVMGGGSLAVELIRKLESQENLNAIFPILMVLLAAAITGAGIIIALTRNNKAADTVN